ncbi:MAG: DUF721 domain-containing protein [Candidatus Liberibacter europaeus]|uniref:DUF721 domain-containing protein n=1 Tax=Candidatus Liberibacter europaeus TaxID=744859 RepID=A0A2T4VYX0_9HYPH|nr:DUF721 domain-containing protein [Candidatus Liberibacter europaeus]PTL86974.1 MAG: DUF721 domain-containing protein [Candidatus Liberibacter europaeus]
MVRFADIMHDIIDPFIRRRAGISMSLICAWDEIIASPISTRCRPERIIWPRGNCVDARDKIGGMGEGVLIVACEGPYALFLMHDQSKIIRSVNDFFGFCAINKMRVVQKNMFVLNGDRKFDSAFPDLKEHDCEKIDKITEGIENDPLKKALIRFGHAVIRSSYL